jgi:hypothetical protein
MFHFWCMAGNGEVQGFEGFSGESQGELTEKGPLRDTPVILGPEVARTSEAQLMLASPAPNCM